jgi:flavin reductase (DIM6/NTAB) family NADH-FMN oxidoreductase RutF
MQLTASPLRVAVSVSKSNYSHDTIKNTGRMNVCPIAKSAPFAVFEAFGFKSGRDTDKFAGCTPKRSENGLVVLPKYINSFFSLSVTDYVDLGTHGMFICDVTETGKMSTEETMTYTYYQKNVKPKPAPKKKGWICTVCGYIHDEEELPADFECPICKHGADAFERLEG